MTTFLPRDCYTASGERKFAFMNRKEAKRAARQLPRGNPQAYRCPHCDLWHIGKGRG